MRSRYTLFAGLAYLALTVVITYPVAFQLTTRIAGLPGNDSLEFVWSTWWFKHALFDLRANPLNISVLNYPNGIYFPLLPAMSQSFLLPLPLAAFISPVFAFNVAYLTSFPLCGLTGYWLCAELSGDRRAGFVGGLIWAFFPNKMGHALAGHLFQLVVFTLPLAALFLLRLFRQPSTRTAVYAGLAIALAATIHPINVAYFIAPTLIVIVSAEIRLPALFRGRRGKAPDKGENRLPLKTLSLAAVIAGALTALFFIPVFLDAARGQLGSLVERGVVGFSMDLLTFVLPAPDHPFLGGTSLSELAHRVDPFPFETIGYLGLIPLALTLMALRWRWRENRRWLVLGLLTAILSLGPVLQIGREIVRITVEIDRFPILMPYAFVGQLPFFQWSRTPARLNETTMFAMAVLASSGMAALLTQLKNQKMGRAIWLIACTLIPVEYIVRWPMPTSPVPATAALADLADDSSFEAVMNFPVPENTINLYGLLQQTYHRHPMIGGRVYRDQPGALVIQNFLSGVLTATGGDDIAPGPTDAQRAAAFAYFDVGRIIYQPEGDHDGSARAAVESLFGSPVVSDELVSIYTLPNNQLPIADPLFVFGSNWYAPELWQEPTRWFKGIATVYAFSGADTTGALAFTAIPGEGLRRLIIKVNGAEVVRFGVGDWAKYVTPEVHFNKGLNYIEFFDEDGSWRFVGDPRCQGGSAVAGPFPVSVPCDAADRESRELSLAIQHLRFVPEPAQYSARTTYGDTLELLDASAPTLARTGDPLVVHFAWRATEQMTQEYTMFLHLLDANKTLIAGNDSPPAHGNFPTILWQSGQIVKYNVPLVIPPNTPPGLYTLSVGWYVWPSLEHLLLPDSAADFTIGVIQIAP